MATSTLRFALIVALVVGGVVLIDQAFPQGGTAAPPPSGATSSPSPSASPSASPKGKPSPQVVGVRIGVFNGAGVTGLAADTAAQLEKDYGYVPAQVADAPSPVAATTVYYRVAGDRIEAESLVQNFFPDLEVKISRLPETATNVEKKVQVAIYLGTDYAS
ncbi:MAG TPA: LytR C-terminal domain-containing protein, partial [Actinomycetota bacterium]|nr:LytR C-terminal domain-containing protein [Actinomycetota bacterium]